ncbi:DUF420 domain-containing protein [Zavarzinella formosa]|uniref:DUF420 domain-containing protein n=1 Tax=Zavarzinella formosa TaxID=360055 RepID=UPI0003186DC9|nr:DUF420 domain-containing protein [Zavarzinella formosa]
MFFTPGLVILTLKILVGTVTLLLIAAVIAISRGNRKLHGQINRVFFWLTMLTVIGFEVVIRLVNPELTDGFTPEARQMLRIHLCFSIPATVLLPAMLYTGSRHMRRIHVPLAVVFSILWAGTAITGIGFLPHTFE